MALLLLLESRDGLSGSIPWTGSPPPMVKRPLHPSCSLSYTPNPPDLTELPPVGKRTYRLVERLSKSVFQYKEV